MGRGIGHVVIFDFLFPDPHHPGEQSRGFTSSGITVVAVGLAELFIPSLAGQVELRGNWARFCRGVGKCGSCLDNPGGYLSHGHRQGVWPMRAGIEVSPQLWNWYVGLVISMGAVLAVSIAFIGAILSIHWLYRRARNLESQPTPSSLPRVLVRLSAFQVIVVGAILVPIGIITIYYVLFSLIAKVAPNMVEAPPLDFGPQESDVWFSSLPSLLIYLVVLTVAIAGIIFTILRSYANKIKPGELPIRLAQRFLRRYFHDSLFVGCLLLLSICPVLLYFIYNIIMLVVVIFPAMRQELPKIAFLNAENLYLRGIGYVGYWLIVVLFIPAIGLLLRGLLLRWRYTLENPALKLIFLRSLKLSIICFLGWLGCISLYYLSEAFFTIIFHVTY
jgi:hypothetical protein